MAIASYFLRASGAALCLIGLILAPCASAQNSLPGGGTNPDIDVLYVERTPRLAFNPSDTTYSSGQYALGQTVTFLAHVRNWGAQTAAVPFVWLLDGDPVSSGTISVPAGGRATAPFSWPWTPATHDLEFIADPAGTLTEFSKLNNRVSLRTNSLRVGLWVEQSLANYFHEHQWKFGDGVNGFEGWGQRMVRRWNDMFARARIPGQPEGMLDRVALDQVIVVPDGALPLAGGLRTNNPDSRDRTVDMQWGYPYLASDIGPDKWWAIRLSGPFYLDHGSIHEMNHARYHIDLYGFDVHQTGSSMTDPAQFNIQLKDDQGHYVAYYPEWASNPAIRAIVGDPPNPVQMPFIAWEGVHYDKWSDIMGGPAIYDAYSAMAWNWKARKRGRGNMNSPPDIGVFLQDLPNTNVFRFVDQNHQPIAGATVDIYRATGTPSWYGKKFDDTIDLTRTTNANGEITLPRCPFAADGVIRHTYGLANSVMVMRLSIPTGGRPDLYYIFEEVADFNMAYWSGATGTAYYTRQIDRRSGATVPTSAWRANYYNGLDLNAYVTSQNASVIDFTWPDAPASGVNPDNFSVHFIRDLTFVEGWKGLNVETNGGVQVLIDGRLVLDQYANAVMQTFRQPTYTQSGNRWITPGRSAPNSGRRVEVRFRHAAGQARLKVWFDEWQPEMDVPQALWRADYYRQSDLTGYQTSRQEDRIDYQYGGAVAAGELDAADPTLWGSWSTRWTGDYAFEPGRYLFSFDVRGGLRFKVDATTVINEFGTTTGRIRTTERQMDGTARLAVEHSAQGSSPRIRVNWTPVWRTFGGRLDFGPLAGAGPTVATFEVRRTGELTPFTTRTAALAADGGFTLTNFPAIQGVLSVKVGSWLRKNMVIDTRSANVSGRLFELVNGDVDGSNAINLDDFLILAATYELATGDPGYDGRADLDRSGFVGLDDFLILAGNYEAFGDN